MLAVFWFLLVILGFLELIRFLPKSKDKQRVQAVYNILGFLTGFLGGTSTFLPEFKIDILYPLGNFGIPIYCLIITYAILRHHLLDIRVAVTRTGIFLFVYLFVLGIPFWFGYKYQLWKYSTWTMLILSTSGPFIYNYLRRRAEDIILKEQRLYQRALHDLSSRMTRIRNPDELVNAITSTIKDTIRVGFAAIYLKEEQYKSFQLRSHYSNGSAVSPEQFIPVDSALARLIYDKKAPLLGEETRSQHDIAPDFGLITPYFIEDTLLGFLILGTKPNNQIFTPEDIIAFETLSYSTSLAIENCHFWKEIEDRQRRARLEEMDTYSYSLAHEIDNPMQVILGHANFIKKVVLELGMPKDKLQDLIGSLDFILEARNRTSTMVKAIRDFGDKTTGEFKPLSIEEVVDSFAMLYSPKFKENSVFFEKASNLQNLVFVMGEKPQLMQILFILADNAVHALTGLAEKKITLKIETLNHDWVRINVSDNGYGIKKEMIGIIFEPFTTTKASTEGTGMGLHNAKKMVQMHKGKIWAESEGPGKGATLIIELPIAKDVKLQKPESENKIKRMF